MKNWLTILLFTLPLLLMAQTEQQGGSAQTMSAQLIGQEEVISLPNVNVDTLSFPALRILRQLQQHEQENWMPFKAFDVYTEGEYVSVFKSSKWTKSYLTGFSTVFGLRKISKLIFGNELLTHKFHTHQRYDKKKLKDVEIRLDSANVELTEKQYDALRKYNFDIDTYVLGQPRSPKSPWGTKRYERYDWLLVDTFSLDGHRVDVLQFTSRPSKRLTDRIRGGVTGRVSIIEDYWRIVEAEIMLSKNETSIHNTYEQIQPGIFVPKEITVMYDMSVNPLEMLELFPSIAKKDSLSAKKQKKMDKAIEIGTVTIKDGYHMNLRYENVERIED